MIIPKSVLIDGRIFSLQAKGGISQMWAYILSSPSWQQQVRAVLFLYPGYEKNVHLAESGLLNLHHTQIIKSQIPPSDNDTWAGVEHYARRREQIAAAGVTPSVVVNTYYGENVFSSDRGRYIVIAYDFAHEELPELNSKSTTASVLQKKQQAFSQASHICFISNSSRKSFFEHYDWYLQRETSVIYLGHHTFQPQLHKAMDVILHVGTRGGYKNFETIAVSLQSLMAKRTSIRVFLLGGEPEDSIITDLKRRFPGRVWFDPIPTDREMDYAMATATIYVSASLYEGFGIPLLNAMRMKTVPVVSDIPVYREIAGSHAIFFKPKSSVELENMLDRALLSHPSSRPVWRTWDDVAHDYTKLVAQRCPL